MDLARNEEDEEEEDAPDREDESDAPDDLDQAASKETANITMAFQERSLREYFQAVDVDENGLRTPPRTAHLTVFEMCASRLLTGCDRPNYTGEGNLLDYAARFWIRHFVELDPQIASNEEVVRVVEILHQFFLNKNNIARTLEYYSTVTYSEMLPGSELAPDLSWLQNVKDWIGRLSFLGAGDLNPESVAWAQAFTRETAFLTLAQGHIDNWFKEHFGRANAECIRFGRDALELVSPRPNSPVPVHVSQLTCF